ncbi:MAG: endopeptidase La [Gammaproteobacteria bacterium]|nr:endopeptidase La [Gammaproteobacteria bacterium]
MTTLKELPVLPLRDTLVFPELFVSIKVGRHASLAALKTAVESDRRLITVLQRQPETDEPDIDDLHEVGTICRVTRVEQGDAGAVVVVQGVTRVRLGPVISNDEYLAVGYEEMAALSMDVGGDDQARVDALLSETLEVARRIANLIDSDNGDQLFAQFMGSNDNAVTQMYRIASFAQQSIELEAQQEILSIEVTRELLETMLAKLSHQASVMQLRQEIASQTREDIDKQQREQLLRQQKRAIEQALGEEDGDEELSEIKENLRQANLPEAAQKEVERELKRLGRMSPNAADYQVARSYLELVAELPWNVVTEDTLDLAHAQKVLDEDHYGLEDVKERILESLAVLQLNPEAKASILCFVGPPGVGKTSLGQSIARAMSRKFERMSLGGLHDEAELRGHRRTYIGAMPGRILQAVRRAGVRNPVLMLDEIDKLGRDFRGDPAAALMEILDPAQNKEFRDNYLNLAFDLSKVLFITTANTLEGIPRPLLDRMEVLELTGYSDLEKTEIARRYLIPRQRENAGLAEEKFHFDDEALRKIIRRYTREAGVRELERSLSRVARKRARQLLQEEALGASIASEELRELLGPEKFKSDKGRENLSAGVAPGLAWTEAGGDVLYVEATLTHKDEKVTITGHLGQVMQESVKAARSYIWSAAEDLHIDRKSIEECGVHVHVPAGAVPKDGPSAGITMATALASAYSKKHVRDDIAMTGELTLTGLVLPVGGVREKILAAHRTGFRHVILPRENEPELDKLPEPVRDEMEITLVDRLEDVVRVAIPDL